MSTQRTVINWLLVYLLVFLSGSWREQLAGNRYLVFGFLAVLVAWYLFTDRKISDRFVLYVVVFFALLFSLNLYTSGGLPLASAVGWMMKLVMAYLVLKTVGADFINIYIKLIVFLAVVSLFGYASDQFHLFEGLVRKLPPAPEMGYEGIFYLYRFPRHMPRNNSIFYEPGAYQGFLNGALFLLMFTKTGFNNRTKRIFFTILAATLVTTFSTTRFVIFAAMFPVFLYRSRIATFSGKIMIVAAMVASVIVFSEQFYTYFVVKMNKYTTAELNEYDRSSDYKADLIIFRRHIFGIGFKQYQQEFSSVRAKSLSSGSNGVTMTLAMYGLPFSLFLFGSFYWALQRLLRDLLLATLAFGMLMLFLWGEAWYVGAPIIYAIFAAAFVFDRGSVKRDKGELASEAGQI